ncbi:MAG: DegT/DnrJ/EryC1/StrS family aminotransferase [Candidatus Kapabacteria bacterium]|jgi:dTDP-4-amino-4,6-dideoxygalactose transaminase|nr:DegT/DnrJ/EryC1/StrS family aminotransferase [Candidatus Kapabacteria bacterium]
MNVPLLDLKLQYQTIKKEVEPKLLEIAESQMLILGKEVAQLEKDLAEYCGASYAVGVSSGTDALLIALMVLEIKAGDEVILPTYSFFATAGVVARVGATPVFVDSDPVTFNIDPKAVKAAVTDKTKAIIPVHLYGQCADMKPICDLAEELNLYVIEDCAQAIGCQYSDGSPVGSMGTIGCYSFYPTKNLGAFGDGGIVVTKDKAIGEKLMRARNHGMEPKYYHDFVGGNFRLDAMQAAVLNIKFPHLNDWHQARRDNADLYTKLFIDAGLATQEGVLEFDNNNKVRLPKAVYKESGHKNYHIYNQYVIHVENRDNLRKHLADNSIGSEIYYPVPFHKQGCFAYLNNDESAFPVADKLAAETIALPIFAELESDQIKCVFDTIAEFYKK